ncbi:hypothetical protein EG329_007217 [Mollisiaceae sp. DMI_Dod_QoI]|nr:hypothetical protein EG329_007217 [Helotiales sp. DMI_Dod_QoI]
MSVASMKNIMPRIFLVALFFCLLSPSLAQLCSIKDPACLHACNVPGELWTVNSPQDIDALSPKGCNYIQGSIGISTNFSGQFILDGVLAVTETIEIQGDPTISLLNPSLSTISMPDLLSLGYLEIGGCPQLTNISMPNLQNMTELNLEFSGPAELNFTSLRTAGNIGISGPIVSMDFDSLLFIGSSHSVSSNSTFSDPSAYGDDRYSNVYPPLAIRFPSLYNATAINLSGNLSEIHMPSLAIARNGRYTNGIIVETYGNPIDIEFPLLDTIKDASFSGTIRTILLPSLQTVPGHISISAITPISLNFTELVSITRLYIGGNITGVGVPALKNITSLEILSSMSLSCTPSQTVFESINNDTSGYQCDYPPSPAATSSHLSTGAKVGIGLGVAAAAIAILVCGYGIWWRKKRNRELVKERVGGHELQDRGGRHVDGLDGPPGYSSRAGTELGSVHSEDTIVAAEDEPATPPAVPAPATRATNTATQEERIAD